MEQDLWGTCESHNDLNFEPLTKVNHSWYPEEKKMFLMWNNTPLRFHKLYFNCNWFIPKR